MAGSTGFRILAAAALALLLGFLALPLIALFAETGPGDLVSSLGERGAAEALWLSLRTSLAALVIILVVGTPAAWLIARRDFRGRAVVITLIELPLVLPPAAAGIALLAAFGPNGLAGGAIDDAGIELVLQTAGVVVALTFVAAPFYVRGAIAAFEALDGNLLDASRTLGAGEARTFARVGIPGARAGLASGRGAGVGEGARRVRRDADVRRLARGPHADGAAGDLRVPRPRLRRCAGALGGAPCRIGRSSSSP